MSVEPLNENKINWKVNITILWLCIFLCCSSYTMCIPFLPVYLLRELHVAQQDIGLWSAIAFSITFIFSTIMAPIWGALADYIGQKKMAIRAGLGLSLTYLLSAVAQDVYQMVAIRALCGFLSGFVPACMSLGSQSLPETKMGWGMGLLQTAMASGMILGPLMGGYLSSWFGMRTCFMMSCVALFFNAIAIIIVAKDLNYDKFPGFKNLHLIKDVQESLSNKKLLFAMSMFLVVQSCNLLTQPLITIYVGELMGAVNDESVKMAGIIFSMAGISGIVAAPQWGKWGQRYGYLKIFCVAAGIAGFIDLFQMFIQTVWQFVFIQFAFGLFLAGCVPNVNASLTEIVDKKSRGKAFGLCASATQFGGVVGPMVGSCLALFLPNRLVLVFVGVALLVTSAFTYITRVRND